MAKALSKLSGMMPKLSFRENGFVHEGGQMTLQETNVSLLASQLAVSMSCKGQINTSLALIYLSFSLPPSILLSFSLSVLSLYLPSFPPPSLTLDTSLSPSRQCSWETVVWGRPVWQNSL